MGTYRSFIKCWVKRQSCNWTVHTFELWVCSFIKIKWKKICLLHGNYALYFKNLTWNETYWRWVVQQFQRSSSKTCDLKTTSFFGGFQSERCKSYWFVRARHFFQTLRYVFLYFDSLRRFEIINSSHFWKYRASNRFKFDLGYWNSSSWYWRNLLILDWRRNERFWKIKGIYVKWSR